MGKVMMVNASAMYLMNDWLNDYQRFWIESLQSLKKHIEEGE